MPRQQYPPPSDTINKLPQRPYGYAESDEAFIDRQFRMSIEALERVQALSPGEFDYLVSTPVHSDEERRLRTARHEDIARRALIAAQRHQLSEEEFNIWSGRRKENSEPVKFRFERAFANTCTPLLTCRRGALTGIVRAYIRLQDDLITDLIMEGESARTAEELLQIEREAIRAGFLEFEPYATDYVAGWPCFPRSTGRFRGATRLRQLFEQRQGELPLPNAAARNLLAEIEHGDYSSPVSKRPGGSSPARSAAGSTVPPFKRLLSRLSHLFQRRDHQ